MQKRFIMKYLFFKNWFEDEQKDYEFYKDLILGKLNSGKKKEDYNISSSLKMWKPPDNLVDALNSLGEFKNLSDDVQSSVKGKIMSRDGTLEDIIRLISKEAKK